MSYLHTNKLLFFVYNIPFMMIAQGVYISCLGCKSLSPKKCVVMLYTVGKQFTVDSVDTLTFSERILCCVMGTMLWYHSYCAGGLASALHSRKRVSPSDTAWDWGWRMISSPLAAPGNKLLLQPKMIRFTRTLYHMPWDETEQEKQGDKKEERYLN